MAIARCERCGMPSKNVKPPGYAAQPFRPVGHPNSGVVCGTPDCEEPAVVWLKKDEARRYEEGQRVFGIHTHTAKLRLQ